jgi:hypothetical protein
MGDATTATTTIRGATLVGNTATQNLFNTTATTLNLGGAATTLSIGAVTGTATINNANTVVTGDLAVNGGDITTSAATAALFQATATTVNIGLAATTLTIGAISGTALIRNATTKFGNTTATITTTNDGLDGINTNHLTIAPQGNLILAPTDAQSSGGDRPYIVITNADMAAGTVTVAGGDLYLSTKDADGTITQVNIIFEGATDNGFETTLTVTDPTADRTITLPNLTGTVALTTDLSQFAATTSAQLAGVISDETGSGALVFATSPTLVTPILGAAAATSVTSDAYILTSSGIQAKTASYTLVAGDNGKIITMNVATANNLTVPASLNVGFNCTIIQLGAGQTTIVASGTTLNSYQGYLKISGQHGSASIVGYTSNVYNVAGNLSA